MQSMNIDYALFEALYRQEVYRQEANQVRLVRELRSTVKKQRVIRRRIGLSLVRLGLRLAQFES